MESKGDGFCPTIFRITCPPLSYNGTSSLREGSAMKKQSIHITFHNPNTEEETAKYLTKLIAGNIADKIIQAQANRQNKIDSAPSSFQNGLTM